jgi:DNA end-binding protein Ku
VPQREGRARRRARLAEPAESDAASGPRPIWSGSLSFGLVSVPVELHSAQRGDAVPLRMLASDGAPLAREYVCPKEQKPLARDEIVRGYEVKPGRFVVVEDEELAALAPRRSRDIELQRFVPRAEVDPAYFERAYYLVPVGERTKAYHLLAEIMEETGRAGIATFVMREHAHAIAIFADGGILRGVTLRFADELRTPESLGLPKPPKLAAATVRTWEKAVAGLAKPALAADELGDDSAQRLLALARAKRERGEDVVEAPPGAESGHEGGEVIDLMALLKERLGVRARGSRKGPRRARPSAKPRRRRARARRA